jgi:anti-sigma factor RsiW
MQHPDEGTIHSWLDGALSAEEAARVEAHVKDCPECAAAVAEARGFIAASSRILTALDNAPRGVIPAAAPKKRVDPIVWRVAATLLVVAGGTFVVLRNQGRGTPIPAMNDNVGVSGAVTAVAPDASSDGSMAVASSAANKTEATRVTAKASTPIKPPGNPLRAEAGGSAQNDFPGKAVAKLGAADISTANENSAAAATPPVTSSAPAAAPPSQAKPPAVLLGRLTPRSANTADAGAPALRALTPAPAGSVAALDAATERQAIKIVGTARQIGAMTTLYEVAPGDTVTLTETVGAPLEGVVTGMSAMRTTDQSTKKSVTTQATKSAVAPAVTASDSQGAAGAASPAPAQAVQVPAGNVFTSKAGNLQVANGVTTISWTDPVTRNVLKLSGRMSPARLQQVKTQIERERAAEAAKKKP